MPFLVSKLYWAHVVPWSIRRYAERNLPMAQRTLTDAYRISDAERADDRGTSEPLVFLLASSQLQEDEYLVDAVVEMKGRRGYWHIVHVLSDDENGAPVLRRFESVPIQNLTRWSCYP
jgi:hypothetical protein